MNIKELIRELKKYDDKQEVYVYDRELGYAGGTKLLTKEMINEHTIKTRLCSKEKTVDSYPTIILAIG